MPDSNSPRTVNIKGKTSREINEEIFRSASSESKLILDGATGQDSVLANIEIDAKIEVNGDLGDYCFLANQLATIEIHGDVECSIGQGIAGGNIIVWGNAGVASGSFARDGWLAIYGTTGPRSAVGMTGGEVIIRGSAGPFAGWKMRGGTLVIGGNAGADLGSEMEGGLIFVRGEVESLAEGVEEFRLKEGDHFKLGLLMLKAGIKAAGKDFRGFRKEVV